MKKFSFLMALLSVPMWVSAQDFYMPPADILIADFDDVTPVFDYCDPLDSRYTEVDTIIRVKNPNPDAVNPSEYCGQYFHNSPRQYEGVYFTEQPHSRIYNTIKFKYLIAPGVMGRVEYKVITNDNFPDTTFNVLMYPIAPKSVRFHTPEEGDGNWHEMSIEFPASNNIRALAIGFNSDWSPGGKNPDNESEVDPKMGGLTCYFDDIRLCATENEYHTLYFEQFDTPTPYWVMRSNNSSISYSENSTTYLSMSGGIQPISSADTLIYNQLWTGSWYNDNASMLLVPKGSHIDLLDIPTAGYTDYMLNIDFGSIAAAGGEPFYGVTNYMDVSYRQSGTEEWNSLERGLIEYDKLASYMTSIQFEEMQAMDLRISVDTAECGINLNKVEVIGLWTGGNTGSVQQVDSKPVEARYCRDAQKIMVESEAKIEIYGSDGRLKTVSSATRILSVAHLPKGIYIARITSSDGYTLLKFVR